MTLFLVLLSLIVVAGIAWTLVETARDGYGPRPTTRREASRDDRVDG